MANLGNFFNGFFWKTSVPLLKRFSWKYFIFHLGYSWQEEGTLPGDLGAFLRSGFIALLETSVRMAIPGLGEDNTT